MDAFVALLKSDLVQLLGQPVLTFLQSVQKDPTPLNEAAAWIQLQGAVVGAGPQVLAKLQGDLAALIIARVQALMTQAVTPQKAA